MIVDVKTCPRCGSDRLRRNGKDYKGSQKFHCNDCKAYGTLDKKPRYSDEFIGQVLKAYEERMSMRGIERTFGVTYRTLAKWIKKSRIAPRTKRIAASRRGE